MLNIEKKNVKKRFFTKLELFIWITSLALISVAFLVVKEKDYLSFIASLIGATALIFVAKGSVIGQFLTVAFSVFYGIISFFFSYYGEMITYLGMTAPIAVASIVTWLKNPYSGDKRQVKINVLKVREICLMVVAGIAITVMFYFILKLLNNANLVISTISVFTSFIAAYLTLRRSEFYAIGYALNDIVLIIMWIFASISNLGYISMVICFAIFLCNDIYGFISWTKMKRHQKKHLE